MLCLLFLHSLRNIDKKLNIAVIEIEEKERIEVISDEDEKSLS